MSAFRKSFLSGILYTALSKYSGILFGIAISAVLSRLLLPKDFGTVGIALVIIDFFTVFIELGIGAAIVQRKDLTVEDIEYIFSFTLYQGLFLGLCFFLASFFIADFYNDSLLQPICQCLSVNLFFGSFATVPNALIIKNKDFKFIAKRSILIQIVTGLLCISLVLAGWGVWALVFNTISGVLGNALFTWNKTRIKFRLRIDFEPLKKIAAYSFFQFLYGIINFLSGHLDALLIGKLMSLSDLAYYQKSYSLMLQPVGSISSVINPVLHPVLSDYQDDKKFIEEKNNIIFRYLSLLGLPLSVFFYFTANEIILLLFGNQWTPAVLVFKILSISIGIRILVSPCSGIYQATNNTKGLFYLSMVSAVINIIGLLIGLIIYKTLIAVAWAISISNLMISICNVFYLYTNVFKTCISDFFKSIADGIYLSLLLIALFYVLSIWLENTNMFLHISTTSTIFLFIWLGYLKYKRVFSQFKQ